VTAVFQTTPERMWLYLTQPDLMPCPSCTEISLDLNIFTILFIVNGERSEFFAIIY